MSVSTYYCAVLGEDRARADRLHPSTQRRMKAFAIAMHIPVALWAVTGYIIASRVFRMPLEISLTIAFLCAFLIYLVERLVLAPPKSRFTWIINAMRIAISVVIALIGATAVDLTLFEREIEVQLRKDDEARINQEFDDAIARLRLTVEQKKADWVKAQDAANCEANGTCGSRTRSVGPVYRQLARQAETLRQDYLEAQAQLESTIRERTNALDRSRQSPGVIEKAGLLSRIKAFHAYASSDIAALWAWRVFFVLVLFLEMMVVLTKLCFPETIDDRLEAIREQVAKHKAERYCEAITSPLADARDLLDRTAC